MHAKGYQVMCGSVPIRKHLLKQPFWYKYYVSKANEKEKAFECIPEKKTKHNKYFRQLLIPQEELHGTSKCLNTWIHAVIIHMHTLIHA